MIENYSNRHTLSGMTFTIVVVVPCRMRMHVRIYLKFCRSLYGNNLFVLHNGIKEISPYSDRYLQILMDSPKQKMNNKNEGYFDEKISNLKILTEIRHVVTTIDIQTDRTDVE